ncbi:hypothetical protein BC941DRAFT_413722 [Chlamydoabsidia padenii]|nr:hypothetical protein BC941DRAFT_413722 [Chlamydoabsidia padenii]
MANDHGAYTNIKSPHQTKSTLIPRPSTTSTNNSNSTINMSQEPNYQYQLKVIGNYSLTESLGKGSMGKVKLGVHNVTGEKVI